MEDDAKKKVADALDTADAAVKDLPATEAGSEKVRTAMLTLLDAIKAVNLRVDEVETFANQE